ncbi:kinase-like protein, partial [Pluteus cervinus]
RFYTVELIIALEFLHSEGIIHRDIKTANLFVSQTGHLLLGDFGFAKDFHKKPSLPERVNLALGSPYEASPEIYLNQYYSFGVDFWAATVSMFYMLTGHPPWYDENPRELRRQVLEDDPVYFDEDPVDEVTRDFVESV